MRTCSLALLIGLAFGFWSLVPAVKAAGVRIDFVDSATGYSLQPNEIVAHPHRDGASEQRFGRAHIGADGHLEMQLENGRHTISANLSSHHPLTGEVQVRENFPYRLRFLLDPLEKPLELQFDNIVARHRDDATLFQGFIVSDETGQPLRAVRVKSNPSGAETITDGRGFYQLYIPLQSPANLIVEKGGYRIEERQYLELSPRGDWNYNFRLERGNGKQTQDERSPLRRAIEQDPSEEIAASSTLTTKSLTLATPKTTLPANATIRVPRNIRVEDGTNLYYVTMNFYEKHTLPHEWIASWNTNALNAGAVPVRCYAIARINGRAPDSDFDICGDSSCQNFKATVSASSTDGAVDYTAGYVVINGSGNIPSTEYSAENNSLGYACGDGFTAPTGGCLYDPICAGHDRSGHGRGMCQRGTHRWGEGGTGYPVRDWIWMVNHYYPNYTLVKGAQLVVGDDVESTSSDCNVRACTGGGIGSGVSCPLITSKASGQTGVIIGGPTVVTNDSKGFTWYQVRWNDANSTTGWSCENYLDRVVATPSAPTNLIASAAGSTQINLSWGDSSSIEAGFYIERAPASSGPWLEIATLSANVTTYSDKNLYPGSTWYYRVRSYNSAGNSSYTSAANATTPNNVSPTLGAIQNRVVTPGTLITFTNTATAPDNAKLITDFNAFQSETANGVVLFDTPSSSGSTTNFLNGAPEMDIAAITDTYPSGGQSAGNVLKVICQFTNNINPWLRLITAGPTYFADPVIDFTKKLRFDIYADQAVQVAVGCRETTTSAGTAIGADGGTSGAIEWAGVTNVSGTAPMPTRTLSPNTWTTLTFDFASEPIRSFSGGNGILSTSSGLGVLEHLAIVPKNGTNTYTFYLDNFAVLYPRTFTYSLGAGAPTGATVDANTGVFSWTPSLAQSPSTNTISVIVADNSTPPLRATNSFTVTVSQTSPTVIITQPQSTTANVGSSPGFTVEASGISLKYQWLFNATNVLSGQTNTTLTVTNCQLSNAGSYSVIVSNTNDRLTSSDALLTVFAPIAISAPPANRTNNIGDNAQFTISATGTNLGYQWQFNGSNIAGETNSAVNIPVNDITNEGVYTVIVSSPVATNVSASASLSVPYFELKKITQWNFNSAPSDNNLTTGSTTPSVGTGSVNTMGGATGLFGDSGASDPASLGLDNTSWLITNYPSSATGNKIGGIQVNASTLGYDQIVVTWEQRHNARASKYARFQYTINGTDWIDGDVVSATSYGIFQFKSSDLSDIDGVANNANFAFRILAEWESTATGAGAAAYVPANAGNSYSTDADIRYDLITVMGSITEPTITSQPQSISRVVGQSVVFNVSATGVDLSYRWQKDGVDLQNDGRICGVTSSSLTISNLTESDAGSYSAVVTVAGGLFSDSSDSATLTVFTPVSITSQPQSQTILVGDSASLSASAIGTAPLAWQWLKNGANIPNATDSTIAFSNAQLTDSASYSVVISNVAGAVTSSNAVLLVTVVQPTITSQPVGHTNATGASVAFNVSATGGGLTYQWRKNGVAMIDTDRISGTSSASLVLSGVQTSDIGSYSVVVANTAGSATSSVVTLAVFAPATIISGPTNQLVLYNSNATFKVTASGAAPLTYQWLKNGTNKLVDFPGRIAGATSTALTILQSLESDVASYSVLVSNIVATATSSNALLIIVPKVTITSPAPNAAFSTAAVQVKGSASDASGKAIKQIFWQLNGGPFSLATGTTNWTATVSLRAGTNVFAVKSVNTSNIESLVVPRNFFFSVSKPITIGKTGIGTISGAANGQLLLVGRNYKITAVPGTGYVFSNWTGTVSSSANPLTFMMQSNTALTANFVPNPFIGRTGIYNGLFSETNALNHNTSGFFTFTLASSGAYSGKFYLVGISHSLTGKFDIYGQSHFVFASPSVAFDLALDFDSPNSETVSGSVTGLNWTAALSGGRAKYIYSPPAPQSTNYTLAFLNASHDVTTPGGDGFANLAVKTTGQAVFSGGRASDDAPLAVPVTYIIKNGDLPFYVPLYGGRGSLTGWLTNVAGNAKTYAGTVTWIKMGPYGTNYINGFTNQLTAVSSTLPPLSSTPAFQSPNAMIILSGATLASPVTNYFWLNNNVVNIFAGQTNGLTLSLSKTTGQWSGSFKPSATGVRMPLKGILLHDQNQARGYFLNGQSGYMFVDPY